MYICRKLQLVFVMFAQITISFVLCKIIHVNADDMFNTIKLFSQMIENKKKKGEIQVKNVYKC